VHPDLRFQLHLTRGKLLSALVVLKACPSVFGWAPIGLDPVSVGIDNEGRVVVGAVLDAQPRRTVIATADAQGSAVKRIDGGAARRHKAEVQTRLLVGEDRPLGREDPERDGVAPVSVADQGSRLSYAFVPSGSKAAS